MPLDDISDEARKAKQRARYALNRDKITARDRARRAADPERFRKRDRLRSAAKPEIQKRKAQKYWESNKERRNAKGKARKKNLTPEQAERYRQTRMAYYRRIRSTIKPHVTGFHRWMESHPDIAIATPEELAAAKLKYWNERRKTYKVKKPSPEVIRQYRKSAYAKFKERHWESFLLQAAIQRHKRRALKKAAGGSFTAKEIAALYIKQGRKCATCKRRVSDKKGKRKYHIDHVTPLIKGGSNDIENIALLCQSCNNRKWAKDPDEFAKIQGLLFF